MKKVKLEDGFEVTINDSAFDDMEFVDLIAECEDKPYLIGKLVEKMTGKDGKKAIYDHFRTEDGRVPVESISGVIEQIFNSLGEEKN